MDYSGIDEHIKNRKSKKKKITVKSIFMSII